MNRAVTKTLIIISITSIICSMVILIYPDVSLFLKNTRLGEDRTEIGKTISLGMKGQELIQDIGYPDEIELSGTSNQESDTIWKYNLYFNSFPYGEITFNDQYEVKKIYFPNNINEHNEKL